MKFNLFICEECGKSFKGKIGLYSHISKIHNKNQYYDKWLKKENEGICPVCLNNTNFISISKGYRKCCSQKCYNMLKYGVEHYYKTDEFKEKRRNTIFNKYGVYEPLQSKKCLEKREKTNLERYGAKTAKLNKGVNEKYKQTCLLRYGVENIMHNHDSFEKMQKTSKLKKVFKDTNLWYQGSYELDFLEKFYNSFSDIQRAPSIKYKFNNKNKIYYPDFFIPSLNLIIEIKCTYFLKKHKALIECKEKFVKRNNYNYVLILDKNYNDFIQYVNL